MSFLGPDIRSSEHSFSHVVQVFDVAHGSFVGLVEVGECMQIIFFQVVLSIVLLDLLLHLTVEYVIVAGLSARPVVVSEQSYKITL